VQRKWCLLSARGIVGIPLLVAAATTAATAVTIVAAAGSISDAREA